MAQEWRDALCSRSLLSEGRWVKVRVASTGMYKITHAELRRMGFTQPERVRIYGYGGRLLSQQFASLPPCDLPQAPTYILSDGLLFYARGTVGWKPDATNSRLVRERNFYSDDAYYFLTDEAIEGATDEFPAETSLALSETPLRTFDECLLHEDDAYSWAGTGRDLYEAYDYSTGNTRDYKFSLRSNSDSGALKLSLHCAARSIGAETTFSLSVNGAQVGAASLSAISQNNQYYVKATEATLQTECANVAAEEVTLTVTHTRPSGVSGRVDYLSLQYPRRLRMDGGSLAFRSLASIDKETTFALADATDATVVWDVTSPGHECRMNGTLSEGAFSFAIPAGSLREFIAFTPDATDYPSVEVIGQVENQNLHGLEQADMIIVAPDRKELLTEAERLAEAHRLHDGLTVQVLTATQLYHEFSSGTPDATAYRRFMKMLYDRAGDDTQAPRYLLLFGDCSFDNRMLAASWQSASPSDYLLSYQSENSLEETSSYITDDYFGFLDDDEGSDLAAARLDIGIGRFPVRSAAEARAAVDKTIAYMENREAGAWKQSVCFVADDGDENLHVGQAEVLASYTEAHYPSLRVNRIYADAYQRESSAVGYTYPDAHTELLRRFDQGMLVVNYTGHGSTSAWAAENLLTTTDIAALASPRLPLWITATCDFTRFDDIHTSAGEEAFLNASGGAIALFTTTRAVYASQNTTLNQAFIRHVFSRPDGKRLRLGDIMRISKCDASLLADQNKLNFTLIGDPALTLAYPEYHIEIEEFAGRAVSETDADNCPRLQAGALVTVRGRVLTEEGSLADSFEGTLHPTVFDSRVAVSTLDNLGEGTFEYTERSKVLYAGTDSVQGGRFAFTFRVPLDINYSDEQGMLSLYALDGVGGHEAGGSFDGFTVGGTADDVLLTDSIGPQMRLYLNTPDFMPGGRVNETPLFVAELEDAAGINTVGSGIGHDLTLCIDGDATRTYRLNDYYVPVTGDYTRGTVRFSIPELSEDEHTLTFRAWNLLNHSTTESLAFEVVRGLKPRLLAVRCLRTPARTSTTFLLNHDRPGSALSVRLYVYDTAGRLVWTHEEQGVSAGQDYYVEWDLCSGSGQRLSPGVYLYRVIVTSGSSKEVTKAQKLLILAQ